MMGRLAVSHVVHVTRDPKERPLRTDRQREPGGEELSGTPTPAGQAPGPRVAGVAVPGADAPVPASGPLVDTFGRTFDYLRIAVTDACNLRCVYCMPEEGVAFAVRDELLTLDELTRVIRVVSKLGVSKIRFTGGEPLVRKDITELVRAASSTPGVESVHMTTNGVLLHRHAAALADAGLTGVNISLDTLDPERFLAITRRTGCDAVLAAIRLAGERFRSVKVNVVAMRGFNDDELPAFVELTREQAITVRFIELMPFDAHQIWKTGKFFHADWIVEALREAVPSIEPASGSRTEHHVFHAPGHAGKVAVIPAYTRTLCGACNRIRLTADGKIRNCLYAEDEFDVRAVLRGGGSDDDVGAVFRRAMWAKHRDGWRAQRATGPDDVHRTSMTQIGG